MTRGWLLRTTLSFCAVLAIAAASPAAGSEGVPDQFGPLHPPPPYPYRDSVGITVRFKTTPEALRALVPAPLVPNPDGSAFLFVGRQRSTNLGTYHEAILGVPATLGDQQGAFMVVTYVDDVLPLATGRERGGWHKKDARFTFVEREGIVTATVERHGATLARIEAHVDKPVSAEALAKAPTPTYFNLKIIPSATMGKPPAVAQLTRTIPSNRVVKRAINGTAKLELRSGPGDPLGTIPVLQVLGAQLSTTDMDLTGADVVHDYLKAETAQR
jgi:acetoacetate decarboxylase